MPNDAKLGLVTGVGLVILIAAVFFRREPAGIAAGQVPPAPQAVSAQVPATTGTPVLPERITPAKTTSMHTLTME